MAAVQRRADETYEDYRARLKHAAAMDRQARREPWVLWNRTRAGNRKGRIVEIGVPYVKALHGPLTVE